MNQNVRIFSEAGHAIGLGGRGRGSSSDQEDGHARFGLIDFGNASSSWSVEARGELGLTAAAGRDVEVEVWVKSCICGNDPRGWTPFLQSVWSLHAAFDFLSRGTQTAVIGHGNII